jgi:hypothetical protein
LKGPRVNQLHHGAVQKIWMKSLVASPGLEPGLSALKGPRVNQLHHGAVQKIWMKSLVASPGLEPGLSALRGRLNLVYMGLHGGCKTQRHRSFAAEFAVAGLGVSTSKIAQEQR